VSLLARIPEVAAEMVAATRILRRAGLLTPTMPRAGLLTLAARAPFTTLNLGSSVALHAVLRPHEPAIIDDRGVVTWSQLYERTCRLANALLELAEPGERIAFMLRNGRENVECFAACGLAGMAAVPVNTWSSASELEHIDSTQTPGLFIVDREFEPALSTVSTPVWWVSDDQDDYEVALADERSGPPPVRGGGRVIIHTSGTTGKPKGAEREQTAGLGYLMALVGFLERVPLHRNDIFHIAPPLFHQFGQGMMTIGLVVGTTLVLPRKFDAEDFCRVAIEHEVTAAATLPVMLQRIAALPEDVAMPQLRLALVSGSALQPALRDRAEARLGEVLYDLYGSTEVGWAAIAGPQDHATHRGTVGRPVRGVRVVIANEHGEPASPGEVGVIHVASDLVFEGYTGVEDDRAVVDDAHSIGDLGYIDDDGYLYVTGRDDDMIVSGGENIFPSEVEGVLEEHPDLVESAVVGVEDEEFGQALHAFVVVRDGVELAAEGIADFVREHLARYKAPKRVTFLDELPRNATGKVLKKDLRGE
jgi:fatty-acyl-CoA synthase